LEILLRRRKLENQLARTTGGIGAMGDHGHAFAIGVAAGVAASILAWKCLGSDKLAASFARPGAAATLKTGREAAPPASGGGVTGGKEGSTVPMTEVLDDEVLKEQLTRNIQFFGEKAQLDLANAFVVVVGLGVSVRRESIVADPAVTDGLASLSSFAKTRLRAWGATRRTFCCSPASASSASWISTRSLSPP